MRTTIEKIKREVQAADAGYGVKVDKIAEKVAQLVWAAEDSRDAFEAERDVVYDRVGAFVGQAVEAKLELNTERAQRDAAVAEISRMQAEIALFHGTFMTEVNDPAVKKSTILAWEENALQTTLANHPNFYLRRLIEERLQQLAVDRVELARLDRERGQLQKNITELPEGK
jgi:hypothetical protein